ncbi:zinc-dependent alcohol dehydrogenase [Aureimonas jatrophae]|uniref:Threonine dehydrogenase n=1 Tax=Aureimonas jatrophae TaxID=1166073 RepID=A0A1H0LG65_9HYPH|nr:zinc-dependent alcohol dehydrogenase [Aureimonas jatrophae]MBB3952499.1 threonine dehydrogenase-like Zn-dependent dehydrogenase [Aureimonas jatrophae]SDO66950.1 Threonine dehydrogenase [Aureimonas jatrophae]
MRALVWHGKEDIRCDTVSDPEVEDPRDAIIKVTSCAICGSDLHLFHNLVPAMLPGDIMGHETMGEVVEVGSEAKGKLKKGDRVVIPFTIQCGECDQCRKGNFSVCQRTNRKANFGDAAFGHRTAGLFGYTHLTGGYPGGQAEYLRVPFADTTHVKVPDGIDDEKLLFLSDILPTGWQAAVQADIQPGDTVAIWGCGPVGQMAIRSAILLGAEQIVAIDRAKQMLMAENDRPHVLREMIYVCRPAGTISIIGVYLGLVDKIPMGQAMNKGLTFRMAQAHVPRWTGDLLRRIEDGQIDPSFVITHKADLSQGPEMYAKFRDKADGCIKVMLQP